MARLYQGKYKEGFMNEQSEARRDLLKWLFDTSFDFENKTFSKDLFDFNKEEMKTFLKSRKITENTMTTYSRWISGYIDWAIKNNHKLYDRNVIKGFTEDDLKEIIKKENNYFHVDLIYELVGRKTVDNSLPSLKNIQDQLLVYLIFLGINGKQSYELLELQYKHIDFENRLIKLSEIDPYIRDVRIDEFGLKLIRESKREKEYFRYIKDVELEEMKNKTESYELSDSPYVFRKSKVGKYDEDFGQMSYQGLMARLNSIGDYVGESLTVKKIRESGVLYVAKKIIDANQDLSIHNQLVNKALFQRYGLENAKDQSKYLKLQFIRKELPRIYPEYIGKVNKEKV
ncbi:phage lytic cycle repressor MrpR family protein [Aquibacillus saliphilus]|uniref:phage lytic cycle repressor MrpR family protein n=1 Tax=Aquibacillus saliphilus TaxID=1909422 RepID=UPI001CEFD2A8|nr:hypothetical protein [Aquibacillus saliphilus]